MGSSVPKTDQLSVSLDKFAELLAAKSNGKVVGHVFYQSLGAEHQLLQGAQAGSLDIGMITNGNSSRFTDAYLVLDLPFLFKRYDDLLDFMNTPLGRKTVGVFEKSTGLKHLYMIGFGSGRYPNHEKETENARRHQRAEDQNDQHACRTGYLQGVGRQSNSGGLGPDLHGSSAGGGGGNAEQYRAGVVGEVRRSGQA